MSRLRLLITAIVLLAFAACGGASHTPAPHLPADTAAQLDELPCPEGVDAGLWAELRDALERALGKAVSTPPTGQANRVDDLAIADNGDGTFTLGWHYRNLGDYDQDGTVALEDIIPLAAHFQETWEAGMEDSLAAVIDGSGNGRVGIEDVTPIAQHYQTDVDHYGIEGAESSEGPWALVSEAAQSGGTGEGRLEYVETIQSPAARWHRVAAYDGEGNPGEPSNAVLRPSNEPIIYEIAPTSGYQHEECTFTAVVSGAEPLTYAWDFGGGASPNTSSQPSPTVTLSDAGEYSATLTISNSYGEASYPFTLTVNARNTWAHTWGTTATETPTGVAVADDGTVYLIGSSQHIANGALLLKYESDGSLQSARTWSQSLDYCAVDLAVGHDGSVFVVGPTKNYGPGEVSSALIVKFDANCNLQWARAWGGPWRTSGRAVAAIPGGGCFVAGERSEEAYGLDKLFVLELDSDGNLLQQKAWRPDGFVYVEAAELAPDGSLYIAGGLNNPSVTNTECLLVKYDPGLSFRWARQCGWDADDKFQALDSLGNGRILVAGSTDIFGSGTGQALLATYTPQGDLDEGWLYSSELGAVQWDSLSVVEHTLYLGGDVWNGESGVRLIAELLPDLSVQRTMGLTGGVWRPLLAHNEEKDIYIAAFIWGTSWWNWTEEVAISRTQIEGGATEPSGEIGDWDGTFVELDLEATVPEGRIDDFDPASDSADLVLMKNFPEQGLQ